MNQIWTPTDLAFQAEVRAFLAERLTPEIRRAGMRMTSVYADPAISRAWNRVLHQRGWAAPAWPVAHGGCDWSLTQHYIFARELSGAGAPPLSPMGIGMCGPALIGHGTPEQQTRHLPPMLSGERLWCQGYSEPRAGSDLAALQMKAEPDDDSLVCTGQKIWTTHAHEADWMFCLVRTSSEDRPQKGITFLLIAMDSPGVTVRPIISLTGEHIQNEVHFDAVRVPNGNVVGEIGQGWKVAKYVMEFERAGRPYAPGLQDGIARLKAIADADLKPAITALECEVDALDALELRLVSGLSHGAAPGATASMLKVLGTQLRQRLTELYVAATPHYASAWQPFAASPGGPVPNYPSPTFSPAVGPDHAPMAALRYFNERAGTIYAGSTEIQYNILSKAFMGLAS